MRVHGKVEEKESEVLPAFAVVASCFGYVEDVDMNYLCCLFIEECSRSYIRTLKRMYSFSYTCFRVVEVEVVKGGAQL
jgi:hypothetical protein